MPQITAETDAASGFPAAQTPGARRFRTLRVIAALILRETGSRDTTSSLGFLWTFIEPIATTIVLTFVFSLMTRQPRLGTSYALFYITGVGAYQMYVSTYAKVSGSIKFSRNLLGFPSVTVLDAMLARFLLNSFINLTIFICLVSGIIAYYHLRELPDIPLVLLSLSMAAALGLGIGSLNAVLFLASPTYESIWGILTRPLMVMSGVIFLITDLPTQMFNYLWWNPLVHVTGLMRAAFYPTYDASYVSVGYPFLIAGITFVLGLVGLHRYVFDALDR